MLWRLPLHAQLSGALQRPSVSSPLLAGHMHEASGLPLQKPKPKISFGKRRRPEAEQPEAPRKRISVTLPGKLSKLLSAAWDRTHSAVLPWSTESQSDLSGMLRMQLFHLDVLWMELNMPDMLNGVERMMALEHPTKHSHPLLGSCRGQTQAAGQQLGARPVRLLACDCGGLCQGSASGQFRHIPGSRAVPQSAFTLRSSRSCSGPQHSRAGAGAIRNSSTSCSLLTRRSSARKGSSRSWAT